MGNKMLEEFYEHLDRLDKTGKKYAIWGAGAMGKSALSYINRHNDNLKHEFFVDNNPALWDKNGVISPKDFFDGKMSDIDTVFICVYVADEVEEQLRKEGYCGKTLPVLTNVFAVDYFEKWHKDNFNSIENLKNILADETSIKTIDTFFAVAKTGDISLWKSVNCNSINKTIEQSILKLGRDESFVDIGAFTGDTVKRFLEITEGRYKRIVCFEPEPEIFVILNQYLRDKNNTIALKYAVSDKNGTVNFNGNMSEGGSISETGNITVETKCLNSVKEAKDASFIKISTLGHELAVLKGAENIIKSNKPKLAYYCSSQQMWEIPMYLYSILPEYKFYIRHYGFGMQGIIGYAIVN